MEPSSRLMYSTKVSVEERFQPPKRKIEEEQVVKFAKETLDKIETPESARPLKKQKVTKESELVAKKFNFIYDQFTENRGKPKMLELSCKKCHAWVMDYQKDGPGNLLRCYVDRIYHPSALRKHTFTYKTINQISSLECDNCRTTLATPMIYTRTQPTKEVRAAYKICITRCKNSSLEIKERIK